MSSFRFPLNDSFEATGHWWLPDDPDKRVPGVLKYSPTDITLLLYGSLGDVSFDGTLPSDFIRFPCVQGILESTRRCTLLNVMVSGNTGFTTQYDCYFIVVGSHTPQLSEVLFPAMWLECTHLDKFMARGYFQTTQDRTEDEFHGLTVVYKQPEPIRLRVDSISATWSIDTMMSREPALGRVTLMANACLHLIPDETKNILWYIETFWRLCDLLTLLTDDPVRPTAIEYSLNNIHLDGWLLYQSRRPFDTTDRRMPAPSLFSFSDVAGVLPDGLNKWCSATGTLAKVIHLFRNAHNDTESIVNRFLAATKSLEALGRVLVQPTGTLRGNVNALFDLLAPESINVICKERNAFVAGLVHTRNYLTHYSDKPNVTPLKDAELLWACEKALLLLRFLLMKYIGLNEQALRDRMMQHPRLMQYIYLHKNHREQ